MANKRTRIIYASQSVFAEGRILYRVQTLGSSTTFNTEDVFELGQLNLTDVVDDSPEVAVTLDGFDYGSIYSMATLAKVPTANLNHNIRQSDGVTFYGTVGAFGDVSTGDLTDSAYAGLPANSGTGIANIVVKESAESEDALAYLHGVQLIDFGRECGVSKGVDIWAPVQPECSLGSARKEIEITKYLPDVFINSVELNYQSDDNSTENYAGETEKKSWFLNDARFISWEEWHVGPLAGEIDASSFAGKSKLYLALDSANTVATLEDQSIGFLKRTETSRPAALFVFAKGGGLEIAESKAIAIFDKASCIPSNAVEYFLYDSTDNSLEYYNNGLVDTLDEALPSVRGGSYITGDRVIISYAADDYAVEDVASRPANSDATTVVGKYFAPISTDDTEDLGAVRQGQVEAYLVDPDLIFKQALTNGTITANSITFSGVPSSVDLTNFVGLSLRVIDGPGKNGPAREIISAINNIVGNENNGSVTLGGADWASIRLLEDTAVVSTISGVFVEDLCDIDVDYVGASGTITVLGSPEGITISGVDTANKEIQFLAPASAAPDDGSEVLISVEPTAASTVIVGDYELALRLQNVTFTADLTREMLKELGRLDPYARTLTIPIEFSASIDTTAGDLETFATFAGKLNRFKNNTLTDLDITDLFAKDNLAIVVMVYQQTDKEAGGTGLDRKAFSNDMFGDEYFVNGIRSIYTSTDGALREYPLKTIIAQNLRITDEEYNLSLGDNATQTFAFRGTNQLTAIRGFVDVDLVTKVIESQGE